MLQQLQDEWRWVTRDPQLDVVMEIDEFVLWKKSFDLTKFVQGLFLVPVPGAAFVLGFPVAGGQLRGTLLVQDCDGGVLHRVPLESIYNDQPKLGAQRIAEEVAAVVRENQSRLDECRWGGGPTPCADTPAARGAARRKKVFLIAQSRAAAAFHCKWTLRP